MNRLPFQFSHPIWRVIPGNSPDRFVVACRDASTQTCQVFGCSLEQPDLRILFKLPDPWWIQVYDTWEEVLLMQGYADPGLPIPQGMYAYDLHDGQLRWEKPAMTVAGLTEEGIVAIHPHFQGRHSLVSALTGEVLRDQLLDAHPRMQAYQATRQLHTSFPAVGLADHPIFDRHLAGITSALTQSPVHQIEYLTIGPDTWIHAYTTPTTQPPYTGYLIRQQGETYQVVAGPFQRKGLLLDAFFVDQTTLYFMAEPHSLVVMSLAQ